MNTTARELMAMPIELIHQVYFGNSIRAWAMAAVVALSLTLVLSVLRRFLFRKLRKISERTAVRWDDAIVQLLHHTHTWFFALVALYAASQSLVLPPGVHKTLQQLAFVALLLQMCIWGSRVIAFWIDAYIEDKAAGDGSKVTTIRAVGFLVRLVFYTTVILWGLDNFGINITTLVAGLGVGGIAVALAVQNILSDLFASLTIVFDRPFVVGDSIVVGEFSGKIEHVGLKTTRIRSLTGEELIFPNAALLQSKIRNFKRMVERRALFSFGVVYETDLEKLAQIPQEIRAIIERQPETRFDRAHFKQLSPSSLDFEAVYWVTNPDFNKFMDIQQNVNLELMKRFRALEIQFAYPTQMVYQKDLGSSE